MKMRRPTLPRTLASVLTAASGLTMVAAIGAQGVASAGASTRHPAKVSMSTKLSGVCPNPLIVQTNWLPEADHAALYQLIGPGGTATQYSYEGPLGKSGIKLQILSGGPGDSFLPMEATLTSGNPVARVTPQLGLDSTEGIIQLSAKFPTVGVFTLQDHDPQVLMYDPTKFADLSTLKKMINAAKQGAKFYVSALTTPYVQYLIDAGVPQTAFIGGYSGDLAKFATGGGNIINQGYADSEPYTLANDTPAWGAKKLKYTFIYKLGLDAYPTTLFVAKDKMASMSKCLTKLVPMLQQAEVDYFKSPTATNKVFAMLNPTYTASYWTTPVAQSKFAATTMLKTGIVGNASNGTGPIGGFNFKRVATTMKILLPIYATLSPGTFVSGVKPADVVTNKFIDPSIKLP